MKTRRILCEPRLEKHLHGHKSRVTSLCFDPQSEQLVSSSNDHTIMLWNLKDKVRVFKFFGHTSVVSEACFSPTGNLIASSSFDGTVRFWEPKIGHSCSKFQAHTKAVRSIHISYDGLKLLTASNDKSVKLWSVQRKAFLTSFTEHKNWVRSVRFSHNAETFLTASDDKTIKLFDQRNHKSIHTFVEEKVPQTAIIHPSDKYIASALTSGTIKIYDLKMFKHLQIYHCHKDDVNSIDFHSSGNYLFSASNDGTVKILDLLEGRSLYALDKNNEPLTSVACSPDGSCFVFGGVSGHILLWQAGCDEIYFEEDEEEDERDELVNESNCSDFKQNGEKCDVGKESLLNVQVQASCLKEDTLNKHPDKGNKDFVRLSSKMDHVLKVINNISLQLAAQDERIKRLEDK